MNIIKEIETVIENAKINGEYWKKGIPESMMNMDIKLNKIIENYTKLPKDERDSVCKNISTDIAWSLLNFATNMATYSLRLSQQQYFNNGLMALGMILSILDQREILLVMSLVFVK